MTEKEKLINRIKFLSKIHRMKTKEYQEKHGYGEECGCITRESCMIASLIPKMNDLGIAFDDIKVGGEEPCTK